MPGIIQQNTPAPTWSIADHPDLYAIPHVHARTAHMASTSSSSHPSWSRTTWYQGAAPSWNAYSHDVIPPPVPPPPPAPLPQKVWILDCRSCGKFLTNRGMKAVLLLRPSVALYSTDALPANCAPYADTVVPPAPSRADRAPSRTCECLTQTLCCHGCGNAVGYMIVVPCARCTQSVGSSQRATNGHRFVFHASEIAASERHYVPEETSVLPAQSATVPAPAPAPRPQFAFTHSASSVASLGSANLAGLGSMAYNRYAALSPSVSGTTRSAHLPYRSPILDPQRVSPSSFPHLFPYTSTPADVFDDAERPELEVSSDESDGELDDSMLDEPSFDSTVSHINTEYHSRSSSLSPSARARRAALPPAVATTPSSRARELLYARAQLDAHRRQLEYQRDPPSQNVHPAPVLGRPLTTLVPPSSLKKPLRAGDVVYWHNLVRGGEIAGMQDDPRARRGRAPLVFDR